MKTEEQRQEGLTRPSRSDIEFVARLKGGVMVLGAGGKMGPTLAKRLRRAISESGSQSCVVAVSRFHDQAARDVFHACGIETIACDLMDPLEVAQLPRVENLLYMAGRKFGSADQPEDTWASNTVIPMNVAQHFRDSRIVVFSTGNVYPFVSPMDGGSTEADDPEPRGEYAQSCLGRERIFEYYSRRFGTPCLIYRLNYAVDLTYGVLVDIARQVFSGKPVDLSVPAVNVIWQGDANSYAIRSLELCTSPARRLNVTGPETIAVRRAAAFFAHRFRRPLQTTGTPGSTALLNDAGACHAALGYPEVTSAQLMEWVAAWIEQGGPLQEKPTKFQVTDGKF